MVKRGNNKFKVIADRFENSRGARYQRRLKELLHKKKLSLGSHFIRLASLEQIDVQVDERLYTDADDQPLTEDTANFIFDTMVHLFLEHRKGFAIQIYTADGKLVRQNLSCLYDGDMFGHLAMVVVPDYVYTKVMASIRQCGKGFSFSKDNMRREVRMADDGPREFLVGLPLRQFKNMLEIEGTMTMGDGPMTSFFKAAKAKGISYNDSMKEAFASYHESQGRSREEVKESSRPISNCAHCHKRESVENRFKMCGACKMVYYCCRECQVIDRPAHKTFCKKNCGK